MAPQLPKKSTLAHTSNISSQDNTAAAPILADSIARGSTTKTRSRGPARGFQVIKRLKEGTKIDGIVISGQNYSVVGPSEKIFKMELGIITRLLAPLRVFYWKQMTDEMKEPLFARLQSEFEISLSDSYTKKVVDAAMASRFRQFKHRCRNHYKMFSNPEEARRNPPNGVQEADWIPLCEHFESAKFKRASKANVENRKKVVINHTSGSKSFPQRIYEMEDSEDPLAKPKEVRVYYDVHHVRADGSWIHPEAHENYEKMEILHAQLTEDGATLTGSEIVEKVLKPKSRNGRGLCYGAQVKSRLSAHFQTQDNDSERESRKLLEEKIENQQVIIDGLQSSQSKLEATIHELYAQLNRDTSRSNH